MSLDVILYSEGPYREKEGYYDSNITHNLGEMADKAGIYKHLWRPDEINIKYASELIEPLEKGLKKLKADPDYFKQFDASNGWGMYIDFVPFVEEYLDACVKNPDAIVKASR